MRCSGGFMVKGDSPMIPVEHRMSVSCNHPAEILPDPCRNFISILPKPTWILFFGSAHILPKSRSESPQIVGDSPLVPDELAHRGDPPFPWFRRGIKKGVRDPVRFPRCEPRCVSCFVGGLSRVFTRGESKKNTNGRYDSSRRGTRITPGDYPKVIPRNNPKKGGRRRARPPPVPRVNLPKPGRGLGGIWAGFGGNLSGVKKRIRAESGRS